MAGRSWAPAEKAHGIQLVDPVSAVTQHADALFEQRHSPVRFAEFEPGLAQAGEDEAEPVGCGALKLHADAPAELKRMWVAPSARGLGVGARLLRELEQQARSAGVRVLRLETNRALKEAIALYRTSGYREVAPFNAEPYAHHWFEKRLA